MQESLVVVTSGCFHALLSTWEATCFALADEKDQERQEHQNCSFNRVGIYLVKWKLLFNRNKKYRRVLAAKNMEWHRYISS